MRILILQLSDLHIKNEDSIYKIQEDKIIIALNSLKSFDSVILLFTGDLAYSGKADQYNLITKFIERFVIKIRKEFHSCRKVDVIIVPGNHDMDFRGKYRQRNDIFEILKDKDNIDYEKEYKYLSNFFNFSQQFGMFATNPQTQTIYLQYNEIKIRFNLFNSALFSCYSDDKDDEIGLHYLPKGVFDSLGQYKEQANIELSILHHSLNWFQSDTRLNFQFEFQNNSNFVFLGHEHNHSLSKNRSDDLNESNIIMGGAYTSNMASFCTVTLDIDKNIAEIKEHLYDEKNEMYFIDKEMHEMYETYKRNTKFKIRDDYLNDIRKDSHHFDNMSFENYFVCPDIKIDSVDDLDKKEISTMSEVIDIIEKYDLITIVGGSLYGKTTLIKKIYLDLIKSKYVPILLNSTDMQGKSLDAIIRLSLDNQYHSKKHTYEAYKQLSKDNRIILIDDIHLLRTDLVKVMNELTTQFGKVIVATDREFNFDIKQQILETYDNDFSQVFFVIQVFHYNRRKELIKTFLESKVDENEVITIEEVKKINDLIANQSNIMSSTPFTVLSLTKNYKDISGSDGTTKGIFNKVFEMNITKMLLRSFTKSKIESVFMILEELAYNIHFNKKYPIIEDDIFTIISEYNLSYMKNLSKSDTVHNLISSSLLRLDVSNKISFYDKNVLAYFVARSLLRRSSEEETIDKFNYLLKNVCFGINNTILLFISYFTFSNKILEHIIIEIMTKFDGWDEFLYNEETIEFLNSTVDEYKSELPTSSDIEYEDNKKNELEKASEELKYEIADIYDYDENDSELDINLVNSAFKSLEILTQILPSFEHQMKKDIKSAYIEVLYVLPNKIFQQIYQPISSDYLNYLREIVENNQNILKIDKQIRGALVQLLLRLYRYTASRISNDETITAINTYDYNNNLNHQIQNSMIQGKIRNDEAFFNKCEDLFDANKSPFIRSIISKIVKSYFIDHRLPLTGKNQAIVDKYFKLNKKDAMLSIAKRKKNKT